MGWGVELAAQKRLRVVGEWGVTVAETDGTQYPEAR